jgi:hypothetical protein
MMVHAPHIQIPVESEHMSDLDYCWHVMTRMMREGWGFSVQFELGRYLMLVAPDPDGGLHCEYFEYDSLYRTLCGFDFDFQWKRAKAADENFAHWRHRMINRFLMAFGCPNS